MRVLGVDPGSIITGWGLLTGSPARPSLEACGAIRLAARGPLAARMDALYRELSLVVERHAPQLAAVENPYHGVNARAALQLAHARGVVLAALGRVGIPVAEYAPAEVKRSVTGNGRAEKAQVALMVTRLVRGELADGQTPDVYDALAVALCHISRAGLERAVQRSVRRRAIVK